LRDFPAATIWELLDSAAQRFGQKPAILAPGREPMTYQGLAEETERLSRELRGAGIRACDRVAVVLPNGPEMAVAFVAVSCCAGCAPLNPNYGRRDFEFHLRDVKAKTVITAPSPPPALTEAADALQIPLLPLRPQARAGEFVLNAGCAHEHTDWPGPDHTALLLHTSGTTSRPKLVPLSASNLLASASHIATSLALTPSDCCLNIMPLFHIHGLMAAVLSTLYSGGAVVCTNGLYASKFFDWMRDFRPTWYTAVPTMHQSILSLAASNREVIRKVPLRLIRSCSAPLPATVLAGLESAFNAPVIEAYGMTEAAHQISANPLPPAPRKPGSVGVAAGPEIAIIDEKTGEFLPAGSTGEVVIRGPNVFAGYEGAHEANMSSFTRGWFRTGDQAMMDKEGYLYLTGRLKELINRGGEKISPREVDEALLAHHAVRQAVAFAIPDARLGEEVGAAVELKEGHEVDPVELQRFVAQRLVSYKVPRLIQVVESIPKGPTGKLQRIGLAERLGLHARQDRQIGAFIPPRTAREERITAIWRELLPVARIGILDHFEALGGDSLLAAQMLTRVAALEGVDIPYQRFIESPTISALAEVIESSKRNSSDAIVVLQPHGDARPLICLPSHDGELLGLAHMAAYLGGQLPVWAIDIRRFQGARDMAELARLCASSLRSRQPCGPYRLAGVCFGGCLIAEIARLLGEQGDSVEFLCLIDALNPAWEQQSSFRNVVLARYRQLRLRISGHFGALQAMKPDQRMDYLHARLHAFFRYHKELVASRVGMSGLTATNRRFMQSFHPGAWRGNALLIRVPGRRLDAPYLGWQEVIKGRLDIVDIPFDANGALTASNAEKVAAILRNRLDRL